MSWRLRYRHGQAEGPTPNHCEQGVLDVMRRLSLDNQKRLRWLLSILEAMSARPEYADLAGVALDLKLVEDEVIEIIRRCDARLQASQLGTATRFLELLRYPGLSDRECWELGL